MSFRDDLGAAHARNDALEQRVAELEAENQGLRDGGDVPVPKASSRGREKLLGFSIAIGGCAAAAGFAIAGDPIVGVIIGCIAVAIAIQLMVIGALITVVPPGFAVVLSGRRSVGPDGRVRGYRVITSGRVVRIPIIEVAERLDLRPRSISGDLDAYLESNERATLRFSASIKIAGAQPKLENAIERFLGRDLVEVERVATEIREGRIRSCVVHLGEAELRADAEKLIAVVLEEADSDLGNCGIDIDTLTIELST